MACKCMDEFDEKLAPLNGRIARTFSFPRNGEAMDFPSIGVERVAKGRGTKSPPLAIPTFCPFCGVRYREDPDAALAKATGA